MATYTVKTVYKVVTDGAQASVARLSSAMDRLNAGVNRLHSVLGGLAVVAGAAFVGMLAGVAKLVSETVALGGAAENARLSFAGMMQAAKVTGEGPEGLNAALEISDALIRKMRADAATLPGTFEELQTVVMSAMSGGLNAGKSVGDIERVSAQLMAAGKMLSVDSEQAGRDFALMLEGRAGAQVAMFNRLRGQIQLTAQEFNQLSPAERFERIERALHGFGPAIDAYANSWDAVSSTAKDHASSLLRVGTAPLFEKLKDTLADLNVYFERHQQQLEHIAETVGNRLANAFQNVVDRVRELGSLLERARGFADRMRDVGAGVRERVSGAGVVGSVGTASAAGTIAGAVGGVPGLGAVLGALAAFATHTDAVALTFVRMQSVIDPILNLFSVWFGVAGPIFTELGTALASVIPGLVGGLSALFSALTGGIGERISMIGGAFREVLAAMQPLFAVVGPLLRSIGALLGRVVGIFWEIFNVKLRVVTTIIGTLASVLAPIVGFVGDHLRRIIDFLSSKLETLSTYVHRVRDAFEVVVNAFRGMISSLVNWMRTLPGIGRFVSSVPEPTQTAPEVDLPQVPATGNPWAVSSNSWQLSGVGPRGMNDRALLEAARANQGSPHVTQHNNITIQNTVNQAEDPDRILMISRRSWLEALRGPIESAQAAVTR